MQYEPDRGEYFPCREAVAAGLVWSATAEAWILPEDDGAVVSTVPEAIRDYCPNDPQLAMAEGYQWEFKINAFEDKWTWKRLRR